MSSFNFLNLLPLRDREADYRVLYLSGALLGDPLGSDADAITYRRSFEASLRQIAFSDVDSEADYSPPTILYEDSVRINECPQGLPVHIFQHGRYVPIAPHKHDFYELVCVVNGSCYHTIGNDRSVLHSGDVAVIPPETSHSIQAFADDCIVFNLSFRTDVIEKNMPDLLEGKHPLTRIMQMVQGQVSKGCYIVFHCGDYFYGDNLLASINEEQRCDEPYTAQLMLALLHALLLHLMRYFGNNTIYNVPEDIDLGDQLLLYIRNHFRSVTFNELCAQFHYSERQLQRMIQKAAGCSFSKYVAQLRIEYVAEQLRSTDASITQIAKWAGIENVSYLYRKFADQFGLTPAEYRKANRLE